MILIEPICNAFDYISLPRFENKAAAERYLAHKGFVYTEDVSMENVIMLLSYDTEAEARPGADGESVQLWVKGLESGLNEIVSEQKTENSNRSI